MLGNEDNYKYLWNNNLHYFKTYKVSGYLYLILVEVNSIDQEKIT